jgi:hypothetical protein
MFLIVNCNGSQLTTSAEIMNLKLFNTYVRQNLGEWHSFILLTGTKEQMVTSFDNGTYKTFCSFVLHDGEIKFFRIGRTTFSKLSELLEKERMSAIQGQPNITNIPLKIKATLKNSTMFNYYDLERASLSNPINFFIGLDKEALIAEANARLDAIPEAIVLKAAPGQERYLPNTNDKKQSTIITNFGRKIID